MLRFFKSIFRRNVKAGSYPESLVKAAIERAVDGTDPWIRAVSGYKKKLRPAVLHAIGHVVALVDGTGPAVVLDRESYDNNPLLRSFFFSLADMRNFLENERALAELKDKEGRVVQNAVGCLVMEKQERVILGAELSGEVVIRDVPQVTVSFEAHRLLDLSETEEETRYQLKRRAFDHLLKIALGRITELKTKRGALERHRALLQSKLSLLQRGGWGFDESADEQMDVAGIEKALGEIEGELLEIGKDDKMLEVYLNVVADVLGRAEEHLWAGRETLIVDRMGIKRKEAASGSAEITLDFLGDAEGRRRVVSLVAVPGQGTRRR